MKKVLSLAFMALLGFPATVVSPAGPARADVCAYPGVGTAANVVFGGGGFCDYPTEINGSHLHCEGGGVGLGGVLSSNGDNGSFSIGGGGAGGASCTWRCPDGVMAPAPNPPGLWRSYLVVMNSTNFCKDHMEPNGIWSGPVLPTEGIPQGAQQVDRPEVKGGPQPSFAPGQSEMPTPGMPGALTPGLPNP